MLLCIYKTDARPRQLWYYLNEQTKRRRSAFNFISLSIKLFPISPLPLWTDTHHKSTRSSSSSSSSSSDLRRTKISPRAKARYTYKPPAAKNPAPSAVSFLRKCRAQVCVYMWKTARPWRPAQVRRPRACIGYGKRVLWIVVLVVVMDARMNYLSRVGEQKLDRSMDREIDRFS